MVRKEGGKVMSGKTKQDRLRFESWFRLSEEGPLVYVQRKIVHGSGDVHMFSFMRKHFCLDADKPERVPCLIYMAAEDRDKNVIYGHNILRLLTRDFMMSLGKANRMVQAGVQRGWWIPIMSIPIYRGQMLNKTEYQVQKSKAFYTHPIFDPNNCTEVPLTVKEW